MFGLLLLIVVTVVFPPCCAFLLAQLIGISRRDIPVFVLYSLGIGPAFLAWIIDVLLRLTPGRPTEFYTIILGLVLIAVVSLTAASLWKMAKRKRSSAFFVRIGELLNRTGPVEKVIVCFLCILTVFLALCDLAVPLTWSDPITHTEVAKILFRDLSAALYPFVDADPKTGFYIEGTHPLGFSASKIVFMLFTGDANTPWHKPMTAAYYFYAIVAVGTYAARVFGNRYGIYAGLLLAVVPRFVLSTFIVHIDPLRLYGFFLPFALLMEFLRANNRGWLKASAIGVALGLHVHAGNVLIVPFLVASYFMFSRELLRYRIINICVFGLWVAVLSGAQYVDNFLRYGALITTKYTLEKTSALPVGSWENVRRGIGSLLEAVIHGPLAPFLDFQNFGATAWLGFFGLSILAKSVWRRWRERPGLSILFFVVGIYFSVSVLAAALGSSVFYKNPRYALIVFPFLAVAGSVACVRFIDWFHSCLVFENRSSFNQVTRSVILSQVLVAPVAIYVGLNGVTTIKILLVVAFAIVCVVVMWVWIGRSDWISVRAWIEPPSIIIIFSIPLGVPLFYLWATTIAPNLVSEFWSKNRIAHSDFAKIFGPGGYSDYAPSVTGGAGATRKLDADIAILTFQPDIYYYGKGYFISEYDKRLDDFYQAANLSKAIDVLDRFKIRYIYIPSYYTPGMMSPHVQKILADYTRVSVVYQGGGTLLRYNGLAENASLSPILDLSIPRSLKMSQDRKWVYPAGLGGCEWFSNNQSGIENWYISQFVSRPTSVACQAWNEDQNWLPIKNDGETLRLSVYTTGVGCLNISIFYRRKTGHSWTTSVENIDFTSLTNHGLSIQLFRPPAKSDAFALAFNKSCSGGLSISKVHVDGVVRNTAVTDTDAP